VKGEASAFCMSFDEIWFAQPVGEIAS